MMKSRNIRWVGRAARVGEMINAYKILVWRPVGKRPLRRCRLMVGILGGVL
jgi:hypothetical protein